MSSCVWEACDGRQIKQGDFLQASPIDAPIYPSDEGKTYEVMSINKRQAILRDINQQRADRYWYPPSPPFNYWKIINSRRLEELFDIWEDQ